MFFNIFGKPAKKPIEELNDLLNGFQKLMETNKKDKFLLDSKKYQYMLIIFRMWRNFR
jgi:hypothetical protein